MTFTKTEANRWYLMLMGMHHRARSFDKRELWKDWAMALFWGWFWTHDSSEEGKKL